MLTFSVQIDEYVCAPANHVPLLLLGDTGTGKSSVMCRAADQAVNKAMVGKISGYSFLYTLHRIIYLCFNLTVMFSLKENSCTKKDI